MLKINKKIRGIRELIEKEDYRALVSTIETLFEEKMYSNDIPRLKEAIEVDRLTAEHIITYYDLNKSPLRFLINPKAVIRECERIKIQEKRNI